MGERGAGRGGGEGARREGRGDVEVTESIGEMVGTKRGPLMGEISPVIGKSESEAGERLQAASSLAARVEGEEGGARREGTR